MRWFRSNVRLGSRLALFALAIQFVLSFGHFHVHGGSAQASALPDGEQPGHHHSIGFAAVHVDALDRTLAPSASGPARPKPSDRGPASPPADHCAICTLMALANVMVVATPPCLLAPQMVAFSYLAADAGFVDPNSAHIAFQPRAPPVG